MGRIWQRGEYLAIICLMDVYVLSSTKSYSKGLYVDKIALSDMEKRKADTKYDAAGYSRWC